MTELKQYIDSLEKILSKCFRVIKQPVVANRSFLLSAHYTDTIGRTLITNKDVIDKFEIKSIILVHIAENMNQVRELSLWLKENIREIARPNSEGYLTLINLVILFQNPVTDDMRKYIEKFSLTKSFLLSLHGWAKAGITGVSLHNGEIFCGKRVIEMKKLFENSLNQYLPDPDPNLAQTDAVGCGIYTN
jgi:hypothetical protein